MDTMKPLHPYGGVLRTVFHGLALVFYPFALLLLLIAKKNSWEGVLRWFMKLDAKQFNQEFKFWEHAPMWGVLYLFPKSLIEEHSILRSKHITFDVFQYVFFNEGPYRDEDRVEDEKFMNLRWVPWADNAALRTPEIVGYVFNRNSQNEHILYPHENFPLPNDIQKAVAQNVQFGSPEKDIILSLTDPEAVNILTDRIKASSGGGVNSSDWVIIGYLLNPLADSELVNLLFKENNNFYYLYQVILLLRGLNNLTSTEICRLMNYSRGRFFTELTKYSQETIIDPALLLTVFANGNLTDNQTVWLKNQLLVSLNIPDETWGEAVNRTLSDSGYGDTTGMSLVWKEQLLKVEYSVVPEEQVKVVL